MTKIKDDPRVHRKVVSDPVRARNDDGTLKGDDPNTPNVNEAWEGGKAPVKKTNDAKKTSKSKRRS
jgi:hypothetical protein